MIDSPAKLPAGGQRSSRSRSRTSSASIHVPETYLGGVLKLCEDKRGRQQEHALPRPRRASCVEYELPLNEVVLDFYDRLKSVSKGYASLDYEFIELRPAIWSSSTCASTASRSTRCR